jgi:hypothetical protein
MNDKKIKIDETHFSDEVLKVVFEEVNKTINKNILKKLKKKLKNMENTNLGGNTPDAPQS